MSKEKESNSENLTLDDLVVDEEEINEELLAEILQEFVRFGKQSGEIIFQPGFENLTAKGKIAIVLLSKRAQFERGEIETEWVSPSEVQEITGISKGTVNPTLRNLYEDGPAENNDGKYRVPPYKLQRIKELVEDAYDES